MSLCLSVCLSVPPSLTPCPPFLPLPVPPSLSLPLFPLPSSPFPPVCPVAQWNVKLLGSNPTATALSDLPRHEMTSAVNVALNKYSNSNPSLSVLLPPLPFFISLPLSLSPSLSPSLFLSLSPPFTPSVRKPPYSFKQTLVSCMALHCSCITGTIKQDVLHSAYLSQSFLSFTFVLLRSCYY